MKAYILKIIGAAILAVFTDILSPSGWKKYIGIVTGIILLTVIISPVANWRDIDVMSGFETSDEIISSGKTLYADTLRLEFSKKVANDVRERIKQEFDKETQVEVEIEVSSEGQIEKISKIIIRGKNLDSAVSDRVSYIYNVDEVILDAF